MKVMKNEEHNSIEIDFEGVKPSAEVRLLMKAYGFWWFGKNKVWCHSLVLDGEFFEKFAEERIRPLVENKVTKTNILESIKSLSEKDQQAVLAELLSR